MVLTAVMFKQPLEGKRLRRCRGKFRLLGVHRGDLDTDLCVIYWAPRF